MSQIKLLWIGSLGTIAIGLPYIFGLFDPTEVAYAYRGKVSVYAGIALLILSWVSGEKRNLVSGGLVLGFSSVALLQVVPVWFWFSYGMSDRTPPGSLVAWIYAIPHLFLFALCVFIVFRIFEMWKPTISKIKLMWIGSLGTIVIGFLYFFRAFIPMEAEVAQWGRVAIILGITLLILSWIVGEQRGLVSKLVLGLGFFGAAVLQVPPVVLWLTMRVATDNTAPFSFVVAGLIAAPHLILFVLCAFIVFRLFKNEPLPVASIG